MDRKRVEFSFFFPKLMDFGTQFSKINGFPESMEPMPKEPLIRMVDVEA